MKQEIPKREHAMLATLCGRVVRDDVIDEIYDGSVHFSRVDLSREDRIIQDKLYLILKMAI